MTASLAQKKIETVVDVMARGRARRTTGERASPFRRTIGR
jgi:hypothetical protein